MDWLISIDRLKTDFCLIGNYLPTLLRSFFDSTLQHLTSLDERETQLKFQKQEEELKNRQKKTLGSALQRQFKEIEKQFPEHKNLSSLRFCLRDFAEQYMELDELGRRDFLIEKYNTDRVKAIFRVRKRSSVHGIISKSDDE